MSPQWTWSEQYQNFYYVTYDPQTNQPIYHWAPQDPQASQPPLNPPVSYQTQPALSQQASSHNVNFGSDHNHYNHDIAQSTGQGPRTARADSMLEAPRQHRRTRGQDLETINGTPEMGTTERLDPSYRMRATHEARDFFVVGRVFSMLFSETAGETAAQGGAANEAFSLVRFGETAFTQIRRFVIVKVKRNFVYACAISTYRGQGTTKWGCDPVEHAPVYCTGHPWQYYQDQSSGVNEYGNGMHREGIEITPTDARTFLSPYSRIRLGKLYAIEWNVKVKDVGMVIDAHRSALITAVEEEEERGQ